MPPSFELAVLTPAAWSDPSIAVAASRAGGLGVLDLEHTTAPADAQALVRTLTRHSALTFGVKVDGAADEILGWLVEDIPANVGTVVLTLVRSDRLADCVTRLRENGVRVLASVSSTEDATLAEELGVDGLVAKGNEAGGWNGEETTFVLLQRLLARSRLPVWAHGGLGPHTIAACYAAGAAGAVLDFQLSLLRESTLPEDVRSAIARMDGSETISLGSELGAACRLYARPRLPALDELRQIETTLDDGRPRDEMLSAWRHAVRSRVGWWSPDRHVWVIGQDAAFAAGIARRYRTVAGALAGFREAIRSHCLAAKRLKPLEPGAPLARSHGTTYPILQGPMTRVSDTDAFAASVAEAGALPFLALALLRGPEVRALLEATKRRLGDRPWGAGILGFVPFDLRQEQMAAIEAVRPPFALIAGGRPDQALSLEKHGIPTYLHVPSPGLLSMFLESGARRFIFEGRECGGHVGPRSSFVLWELMIDVLLDKVPAGAEAGEYHVVFAGGIHDERSAAMVATLVAPLAERGIKVGVLLGTAYLFTEEAVSAGAIVDTFQNEALACRRTILLETGPGHATRCVDTAFGDTFKREKRRLLADPRLTADELRDSLEELNLGRLRIASKGIARNPRHGEDPTAPRFVELDETARRAEGLFMIGQVAALRDRVGTMADLHRSVSIGASERLATVEVESPSSEARAARPVDVAIVGMATLLPKASELGRFWQNIVDKVDAISEIPAGRWDWRRYYDEDPKAPDKVYSKWGGFIDPIPFDPMRYGMPPTTLPSIEPLQLLTLEVVRAALADAGYTDRQFPRERTGVILGVGGGAGDLGQQYAIRSSLPMYVGDNPEFLKQLPEWTEDSFAGILLNVAAGRVANRFDLGGVNYTVDAACASSLAAVYLAVRELEAGTADMMVVGGADTVQNPFAYLCFSKTHALSPRGRCRTFDAEADGIVISEGLAVLVLKRLADAERDGDRIYGVIKSVAGSSDGRDRGLTAPRPEGQLRALERAYIAAGFTPDTVGLIEAHGTGTVAGDQAEVQSLTRAFAATDARPESCAVGSVKSMIGHTKCTAGVAGLVKVALSLYHRVLPPTLHVDKPSPKAFRPGSPFYVNTEARPWIARPDGVPRRAGVSSFGFGGTNFHVTVEEYPDGNPQAACREWGSELFVWTGAGRDEIIAMLDALGHALDAGATPALRDLAYSVWQRSKERRPAADAPATTLAIVATGLSDLRQKMAAAKETLAAGRPSLDDPRGAYFTETPLGPTGSVAFLFPGQGSQHVDMLRELAIHFHEVREAFASADRVLAASYPQPLSAYVFPPPAWSQADARARQEALTETNVAQPALGAADLGVAALLRSLGLAPDLTAGHSYGEYVALCVAGVIDEDTLYALSEARGRAILDTAGDDLGTMAAVPAGPSRTEALLAGIDEVWIANLNGPSQTMVSGTRRGIERAIERLTAQGVEARPIPVACAFHSPLVARARDTLAARVAEAPFRESRCPVFSNTTAAAYPSEASSIRAVLADHLVKPVRFAEQLDAMYQAGARVFVEVGPKSVLTGLVQQNLGSRPHVAVAPGAAGRPGLLALQMALAQLAAHGIDVRLDRLFEGRDAKRLDLGDLVAATREAPLAPTAWMVHGGRSWPAREPAPAPPSPPANQPQPAVPTPAAYVAVTAGEAAAVVDAVSEVSAIPALTGGNAGAADVMLQFQRLMDRFLETQRNVMLAYLGSPPSVAAPPMPTPPERIVAEAAVAPRNGSVSTNGFHGVRDVNGALPHPPEAPAPVMPELPARADRERLTEGLLKIVSERTGYPTEMLGLELMMEADLGIDSIKRVEILGVFQRTHLSSAGQALMERLTGVKTLGQVLDAALEECQGIQPAAPTASAPAETVPPAPSVATADTEVPRATVTAVETSLAEECRVPVTDQPVILTDDGTGVAAALAERLRALGARPVLIHAGDVTDPSKAMELVALIRRQHGAPAGVVHLAPLRQRASREALDLAGWHGALDLDVTALFCLAKALDRDVKSASGNGSGFVIAATSMGGTFASDGAPADFHPEHGGVAGLIKTLAIEWPAIRSKVIDLEEGASAAEKADLVLREMAAADGHVEVGYRSGRRVVLRPRPAEFAVGSLPQLSIDESWVWLVTGGARGITAEVACELAARYRPTLILTGRSPLPADEEPAHTAWLDGSALKRALIQQMSKDGQHPEPARVEQAYARVLQDREIRHNVAVMRDAGATVRYAQVDVRDEPGFSAFLDEIYATYGRLDGVIHGAGVIEDKLVEDKTLESFRRVFATKLDGAHVLSRKLRPESTKLLVFFSSVAARFGNRGQADYAAANEVLNKLAIRLDASWPGRVVALGWGPWGKTGMVSAEIERQFLERGVQIIPPAAGRRVFDDEIRLGTKGACEVILGRGGWESAPVSTLARQRVQFPLLNGSVPSRSSSGALELVRSLDPAHDRYLAHHRIDGKPVFPAAMAMELMAEVVQHGWPESWIAGVRSLQVLRGIVLTNGPKQVGVAARPQPLGSDPNNLNVDVEIHELDSPRRASYRATIQLSDGRPTSATELAPALDPVTPFPMSVAQAYDRWLFHGPLLQGIVEIEGMNEGGIAAVLHPSSPDRLVEAAHGDWLMDPVLIDCAFQLAILWARAYHDVTSIPSTVGAYHRLAVPSGGPVRCRLYARPSDACTLLSARIVFTDLEGRTLGVLDDMEFSCSKALNRAGGSASSGR